MGAGKPESKPQSVDIALALEKSTDTITSLPSLYIDELFNVTLPSTTEGADCKSGEPKVASSLITVTAVQLVEGTIVPPMAICAVALYRTSL